MAKKPDLLIGERYIIKKINTISYFFSLHNEYYPSFVDIRNGNNGFALRERIEKKEGDYKNEEPFCREIKKDVYFRTINFALYSNYPEVTSFLLENINSRHDLDSDQVGYAIYSTIRDSKLYLNDYRDALAVILANDIQKKPQPKLFWIASALKIILEQKRDLPAEIASLNCADFNLKMQQLSGIQEMLKKYLDKRLDAGDELTKSEAFVIGKFMFSRINPPK